MDEYLRNQNLLYGLMNAESSVVTLKNGETLTGKIVQINRNHATVKAEGIKGEYEAFQIDQVQLIVHNVKGDK